MSRSFVVLEGYATECLSRASHAKEEKQPWESFHLGQLEAKPGKEQEVEKFLKSAQPLAEKEPETITWYAIKMGPSSYGIFDTFADESGRNAHLKGEIAKASLPRRKICSRNLRTLKSPRFWRPSLRADKFRHTHCLP